MVSFSMTTRLLISPPGAALPRRDPVERQLRRFDLRYRDQVCQVASAHERLAQLSSSFPALLFALAVPRPGFDRDPTVTGVLRGEKLANLAGLADIPLWLRKFSPEALCAPIPILPNSEDFQRQIGNYIPRSPRLGRIWLRAVGDAYALADEVFTLWIARELSRHEEKVKLERLKLLAIWAWYSSKFPLENAGNFSHNWHGSMNFTDALKLAIEWRQAVQMHLCLGEMPIPDMWLDQATVGGYEFVPLQTQRDIVEEAAAMKNCLRTYGVRVAINQCRIWSIRKEGVRVATLELARRHPDPCPRVVQIRTPKGDHSPAEIWWAAHAWVRSHDFARLVACPLPAHKVPLERNRWVSLWRSYWLDKRRIPAWLPLSPSLGNLNQL